jgi:serine protease Do
VTATYCDTAGFVVTLTPVHAVKRVRAAVIAGAVLWGSMASSARAGRDDFSTIFESVQAAVVAIQVKTTGGTATSDDPGAQAATPPAYHHLPDLHFPHRRLGAFDAQGSGFFIDSSGLLVTSKHVVDGVSRIVVTTKDGERRDARIVGTDTVTDLALLELVAPHPQHRPFVRFAPRRARVGEPVFAVGNPYGLSGSVTSGIVSANERSVGAGAFDDYIQIDAAINRGSSGGPTFDQSGDVIGVNTAIFSPTGSSIGIAFAIPAQTAAEVIEQLRQRGHVERGWLGLEVQAITGSLAAALARAGTAGVLVTDVGPDGPGARSGIRIGDVIARVGDSDIQDKRHFLRLESRATPESKVGVRLRRDAEDIDLVIAVGRRDSRPETSVPSDPALRPSDVTLAVAPAPDADGMVGPGLLVTGIAGVSSETGELDVMIGDVIMRAGTRELTTTSDFEAERAAASAKGLSHLLVMIRRDEVQRFVALPVRAPERRTVAPDLIVVSSR